MATYRRLRWEDTRSFPEGGTQAAWAIDSLLRLDGPVAFAPSLFGPRCVQESLSGVPGGASLTFLV